MGLPEVQSNKACKKYSYLIKDFFFYYATTCNLITVQLS